MTRVLYVGPLNPGGTCYARLKGLLREEADVVQFDTQPILKSIPRLLRLPEHYMFFGPAFRRLNQQLLTIAATGKPEVIWVDKGFWLWPSTVQTLRSHGIFLVQHNTDSLWPNNFRFKWSYALARGALRHFHLYFSSNQLDCDRIRRTHIVNCELTQLGYDPDRFNNLPPDRMQAMRLSSKLLFVGHYEPRTERFLNGIAEASLPLTVFGSGWEKARRATALSKNLKREMLSDSDYIDALKSATIGLGFVSEWNGNETAGRTFEIPACGTFLLAMRTSQHERLYTEGQEAEFFSTTEELVEKAKKYLSDVEARTRIAAAGLQRCKESKYTWQDLMVRDWNIALSQRGTLQPIPGSLFL